MLLLTAFFWFSGLSAQTYNGDRYRREVRPTKNVIVMIPDGTSLSVVSAARWYMIYNELGDGLAIDPYICGTVKTYSSNAPIGDSAPTTSCYMTGMPQQSGNVAIYPAASEGNDLVPVDPAMSYNPLATILEAAKIDFGKAVGLVVTGEFPDATPADCSAHHYLRRNYPVIASQMAYQNLDVMFGSGDRYVSDDMKRHFAEKGISYYGNDVEAFRSHGSGKVWAMWGDSGTPYALGHDPAGSASIREMTEKAIELLSQNENGFFLMVEGSKVDWMAHENDPAGVITEFLAFDSAVGAALDFARKDGNTTVLVLPDHGTGGFTIGRRGMKSYNTASLDYLFGSVSKYKSTARGLESRLIDEKPESFRAIIKEYTDIDVTDEEFDDLLRARNYKGRPEGVSDDENLYSKLARLMNSRTSFGFTTGGHTGEEVFLAAYHPHGDLPTGMNTNIEINHYLSDAMGLEKRLPELTSEIFARHTDVFDGLKWTIDRTDEVFPLLEVKKGRKTLRIPAHKSVGYLNKKAFDIGSVAVYMDKTDTFYLPVELRKMLD